MNKRRLQIVIPILAGVLALSAAPRALSGWYGWDPSVPREHRPGNIYFGSAKDARGRFLAGVTIVLVTPSVDFVTVTDPAGRFRLEIPQELRMSDVTPRCSKNGYAVGQVIKRPPRGDALTPVQVDCVLGPDSAS
jgi:hypothetical protein